MEEMIELSTGGLNPDQIDLLLTHLPVDITFVDAEGHVRYYSDTQDRIFKRAPGIIGRHVEKCHPIKSLDKVTQDVTDIQKLEGERRLLDWE